LRVTVGLPDILKRPSTMSHTFWVESDDVWVADGNRVVWRGKPDGRDAVHVVALPGTNDAVVLLKWPAEHHGKASGGSGTWTNLVRITSDGGIVWWAGGLDIEDRWTSVRWAGGLFASTGTGFAANLDPDTGELVSRTFSR
jgi:hypothetical protein